jgi:hypothetical protein
MMIDPERGWTTESKAGERWRPKSTPKESLLEPGASRGHTHHHSVEVGASTAPRSWPRPGARTLTRADKDYRRQGSVRVHHAPGSRPGVSLGILWTGVGMDVVREQHTRGGVHVSLALQSGRGKTITNRIPLTLASSTA